MKDFIIQKSLFKFNKLSPYLALVIITIWGTYHTIDRKLDGNTYIFTGMRYQIMDMSNLYSPIPVKMKVFPSNFLSIV